MYVYDIIIMMGFGFGISGLWPVQWIVDVDEVLLQSDNRMTSCVL